MRLAKGGIKEEDLDSIQSLQARLRKTEKKENFQIQMIRKRKP